MTKVGWLTLAAGRDKFSRILEALFPKVVQVVLVFFHKALAARNELRAEKWRARAFIVCLLPEIKISTFCQLLVFQPGMVFRKTSIFPKI